MNELDKWSAEAVGVEYNETNEGMIIYDPNGRGLLDCQWTLSDARCMEIFRTWFLNSHKGPSVCFFREDVEYEWVDEDGYGQCAYRDTELACAQAIMEEEHD